MTQDGWQDMERIARVIAEDGTICVSEIDQAIRQADHVLRDQAEGSQPIPFDIVRMRRILRECMKTRLRV